MVFSTYPNVHLQSGHRETWMKMDSRDNSCISGTVLLPPSGKNRKVHVLCLGGTGTDPLGVWVQHVICSLSTKNNMTTIGTVTQTLSIMEHFYYQ